MGYVWRSSRRTRPQIYSLTIVRILQDRIKSGTRLWGGIEWRHSRHFFLRPKMDLVHTHRTAPRTETMAGIVSDNPRRPWFDEFWNELENFANPRDYKLKSFSLDPFLLSFSLLRNLENRSRNFNLIFLRRKDFDYWSDRWFNQDVKSIDRVERLKDSINFLDDRTISVCAFRENWISLPMSRSKMVCGFDGVNGWYTES